MKFLRSTTFLKLGVISREHLGSFNSLQTYWLVGKFGSCPALIEFKGTSPKKFTFRTYQERNKSWSLLFCFNVNCGNGDIKIF